ncbi:hypothetical protein EXIGLDRAFT_774426 [Exidia glandulosa HHB12029]|uniref:Uncharacterized protein n=1 Tax=Exidia glandulosa HHB12029 TaxID=1314781 RepID=A0A165ECK7_EXIGL|nr:hypothetical protein EXIGLDRAFT_774426 [Exidia glandulosa HHB12029]
MKRLWKARRSLSASSGMLVVSPARHTHQKGAKSEASSMWTMITGATDSDTLCARAQQAAKRLIELVSTVERSKLWTHPEIKELYRTCRSYETDLNTAIVQNSVNPARRGVAMSNPRTDVGFVDDGELRLVSRSIQDAFQACADRFTDVYDPDVKRVSDDCEIARERASQLRQRLQNVDAVYNVDGDPAPKPPLSGCLHSRELLRAHIGAVFDAISLQHDLKAVVMYELFADSGPLTIAEETLLGELQDAIRDVDDALSHWMSPRRWANAATISPISPELTPLSPPPHFEWTETPHTDWTDSPSSLHSLPDTPAPKQRLPLPASFKKAALSRAGYSPYPPADYIQHNTTVSPISNWTPKPFLLIPPSWVAPSQPQGDDVGLQSPSYSRFMLTPAVFNGS